jgi:predicted XRE-type DNA-binding protein
LSSGNVFADLGLANPKERLIKAELTRQIDEIITKRKLAPANAANILEVDELEISALSKGKITNFSVEKLFQFLLALKQDIEILVSPKTENNRTTRITIVTTENLA